MTQAERAANWHRLTQTLTGIAALWAVAALLTLLGGWRGAAEARAAAGWTPVGGTVTAVAVVPVPQSGRVPFTVPAVRVAYDYTYDGRLYQADRLRADDDPLSPDSAAGRAWLALSPGDAVTVYVNPADPSQAALDRATTGRWWRNGLILLGLAAVIGALSWLISRRPLCHKRRISRQERQDR